MSSSPPPDHRPPVTVVVIHRDRPDSIGGTLDAYRRQTVPTRLLVVDNGSDPATRAALPGMIGDAELLDAGANLGFGPGGNLGLRRWLHEQAGPWAAVTPHDALPDPDTLEKILDAVADRPRVGLVSADVGDGARPVVQPYLGTIDAAPEVDEGFDRSDYPHGTLMLVRRACVEEIGLFDERYFAYNEEADLGLRAAAAGWECGVVRGAMVRNPGMSASIERVAYLQTRNTLLMIKEHFGRANVAFRIVVALLQIPVGMVRPSARGLHWSPRGRLLAIRDHLRGRYGPPPPDVGGR